MEFNQQKNRENVTENKRKIERERARVHKTGPRRDAK
jgi:hypothetical protein